MNRVLAIAGREWRATVLWRGGVTVTGVFLTVVLAPTLVHVWALERHGRPDYGEIACGYLGMMLAGSAYLAGGILASTLTTSQGVAFFLTLFFWLGLGVAAKSLPMYLHAP